MGECLIIFLWPSFLLTLKQLSVPALLPVSLHLTLCLSPSDKSSKNSFPFPQSVSSINPCINNWGSPVCFHRSAEKYTSLSERGETVCLRHMFCFYRKSVRLYFNFVIHYTSNGSSKATFSCIISKMGLKCNFLMYNTSRGTLSVLFRVALLYRCTSPTKYKTYLCG